MKKIFFNDFFLYFEKIFGFFTNFTRKFCFFKCFFSVKYVLIGLVYKK